MSKMEAAKRKLRKWSIRYPAERFGKSIRDGKDTGNVPHNNLFGKMLDINVTRPFSRDTVVDHVDGRYIGFFKLAVGILIPGGLH